MKLEPRAEDLTIVFSNQLIILIGCLVLNPIFGWAPALVWGCLVLFILGFLAGLRDVLYFARTVTLDQSGCTFSLFHFQRTYSWKDLEVRLCSGYGPKFHDSDPGGAGILIHTCTSRYGRRLAPMTWCRWHHPGASVFLRFPDERYIPAHICQGFTADRDALLALLRSAGVQPHA